MKYDVFISFKNLDENGERTEDSFVAEQVYHELTAAGFSTFYSNIVLQQEGAAKYKVAIEQALDESKILLCVGTKKEYLEGRWVTYERDSFHNDILSGRKKDACIVPYLKNIHGLDVPRCLRNYQTFQIGVSPMQDLIDFIKSNLKKDIKIDTSVQSSSEISLVTGKHMSTYSAETKPELKRLRIQAQNTRDADMPAIDYALSYLKHKEQINVLDMGCAYGYVTKDRFSRIPNAKVVGVDRGESLIQYAKEKSSFDNCSYHVLDLESEDFEDNLEEIMLQNDIEKFDIIFASLVIHHLKNPNKLLRKVRRFLAKDGYIIIRGSDDGSMVTYNDDGLIQKIIDLHLSCDGISDRKNGRKIYSQLISSGYKDVKMINYVKEISNLDLDERYEIFVERFSYRRNYLKRLCDQEPTNMVYRKNLETMDYLLTELENKFAEDSFWYCEIDFVGVAQKK